MFKGMFDIHQWAGIISTLIFFSVFAIAMWMVFLKKKSEMDYMANLPLEDDDVHSGDTKNENHEDKA